VSACVDPRAIQKSRRSWLPVGFNFRFSTTPVAWLHFDQQALQEPLFFQSMAKFKTIIPPLEGRMSALGEIRERAQRLRGVAPAGVIFHVGRCGSTLIANILRLGQNTVVLSEAEPIVSLLGPDPRIPDISLLGGASAELLRDVLTLYAHDGEELRYRIVIKCHALNLLHIRHVRSIWPSTPCVIVIRDPLEIMVSMLSRPPGFMSFLQHPFLASRLYGWDETEVRGMDAEEYCGRVLGRYFEAALEVADSTPVIDYENLDAARICRIADCFNVDVPSPDSSALLQIMSAYSKDPRRTRQFSSDREEKRANSTLVIQNTVERWLAEPYLRLRSLELK
jgi:hypothetical protein